MKQLTKKKCYICDYESDIKVGLCFERKIMECIFCHSEHLATDRMVRNA